MNFAELKASGERGDVLEYVVYKENTLGYLYVDNPNGNLWFGVFGSNVHGLNWMNGPVIMCDSDEKSIRRANLDDFETFRVSLKGHNIKS